MADSSFTIYDLARECEVSVATISRVINGSPSVSAKTRAKIQTAMEKHNYRPNVFARGMNKMNTNIIAVFISDIANPFFSDIVKGIDEVCRMHDLRIILCVTNNDMEQEHRELELMLQKQVDGFIICGSRPQLDTNASFFCEISEKHPVITVNSRIKNGKKLFSVLVDEKKAAKDALSTVLKKGYKSLYVFGDKAWKTTVEKLKIAKETADELNVFFDDSCFCPCEHNMEEGKSVAKRLLSGMKNLFEKGPCLFFCVSDQIALGVVKAVCEANIKIPSEIGVLGFSDISFCSIATPSISTVNQHMRLLGEKAANLFVSIQNGEELEEKVIYSDYDLVERETTL